MKIKLAMFGVAALIFILTLTNCSSSNKTLREPINKKLLLTSVVDLYVYDIPESKHAHLKNLRGYLEGLPEKVRTILIQGKYKIIIVSSFDNYFENSNILENGKHDRDNKIIYLKCTLELCSEHTLGPVLLHEIGHVYNWGNGDKKRFSTTTEFEDISKEESVKLFNSKVLPGADKEYLEHHQDSNEFFAECFAFYFSNDSYKIDKLKDNAPRALAYIKHISE